MDTPEVTLSICVRCRDGREADASDLSDRGGRRLAEAVAQAYGESGAADLGVALRGVHCMSQCKRSCTIALSGAGRFTYLFGDLDPTQHAAEILSVAARYAQEEAGFLSRDARPPAMRSGILGRLPPQGHAGDLVEPLIPFPPQPTKETDPR